MDIAPCPSAIPRANGTWTPVVYTEDGPETLCGSFDTEDAAIAQARRFIAGEVEG